MKIKSNELIGTALDWAVAKCEGKVEQGVYGTPQLWNTELHLHYCNTFLGSSYSPSTDPAKAYPIIEQAHIGVNPHTKGNKLWIALIVHANSVYRQYGPTPLIAAMRCFVASKLGDEVEVPDELV